MYAITGIILCNKWLYKYSPFLNNLHFIISPEKFTSIKVCCRSVSQKPIDTHMFKFINRSERLFAGNLSCDKMSLQYTCLMFVSFNKHNNNKMMMMKKICSRKRFVVFLSSFLLHIDRKARYYSNYASVRL